MKEVEADVSLVRRLVFGETRVAVNAEHRAADGTRIGRQVRRGLGERRGEVVDEPQGGLADVAVVALFVGGEPVAVVVRGELPQKGKELRREVLRRHASKRIRNSFLRLQQKPM